NSLLEQWRDSYPDNDDYDPYDDDMYENHDMSEHLQSICDDLNITILSLIDLYWLMSMGKGLSNLELYKKLYNKNRHEGDHCDATKVARAHGIIANVVDLALDLYLDPEA
ncbi:hypothetical protein Tco_0787178, partial [Tanacetum coccineum]